MSDLHVADRLPALSPKGLPHSSDAIEPAVHRTDPAIAT
jgi:hypothetical protein